MSGQMQSTGQASQIATAVTADIAAVADNAVQSTVMVDGQSGQQSAAEVRHEDVAMVDEGEEEDTATVAPQGIKRQHEEDPESQVSFGTFP